MPAGSLLAFSSNGRAPFMIFIWHSEADSRAISWTSSRSQQFFFQVSLQEWTLTVPGNWSPCCISQSWEFSFLWESGGSSWFSLCVTTWSLSVTSCALSSLGYSWRSNWSACKLFPCFGIPVVLFLHINHILPLLTLYVHSFLPSWVWPETFFPSPAVQVWTRPLVLVVIQFHSKIKFSWEHFCTVLSPVRQFLWILFVGGKGRKDDSRISNQISLYHC